MKQFETVTFQYYNSGTQFSERSFNLQIGFKPNKMTVKQCFVAESSGNYVFYIKCPQISIQPIVIGKTNENSNTDNKFNCNFAGNSMLTFNFYDNTHTLYQIDYVGLVIEFSE